MKKKEIDNLKYINKECFNSLHSWDKNSSNVFNILAQIKGLKKCKWEMFHLSDDFREKLEERLHHRLYEELESLAAILVILEGLMKEMEDCRHCVKSRCSKSNVHFAMSLDCFNLINNMCSCLNSILRMKHVPLRRISIDDKDSFRFLKDSDISVKIVIEQFQEKVDAWKELVEDI